jgi:hypothetical protein
LMHLLRLQGRTLTAGQRQHVLDAFDKRKDADAAGTPLWLTIVAQAVSAWTSYDGLDCADGVPFAIAPAVRTLITDLFGRLVVAHGEALVRAWCAAAAGDAPAGRPGALLDTPGRRQRCRAGVLVPPAVLGGVRRVVVWDGRGRQENQAAAPLSACRLF